MNKSANSTEDGCSGESSVTALRKVSLRGDLYKRPPGIEAKIRELAGLDSRALLERCRIVDKNLPEFVPTECLLYLVRSTRSQELVDDFNSLCKLLLERVLRTLPGSKESSPDALDLCDSEIREGVYDRFVEMLAKDGEDYEVNLDFFEVRFNQALKALRKDVQEAVWNKAKKHKALTWDEETGDLNPKIEGALGTFDPFATADKLDEYYRLRLAKAINSLPGVQRTIIEMLRKGFPIDSKNPKERTISKTIGKTEKTVRNQRDKAFAVLKTILTDLEEK